MIQEPSDSKTLEVPPAIQIQLNKSIELSRHKLLDTDQTKPILSKIYEGHAVASIISRSYLQIKIFDSSLSSIINTKSIDNVYDLRNIHITFFETRKEIRILVIVVQPADNNNTRRIVLYQGSVAGSIQMKGVVAYTDAHQILKISQSYSLSNDSNNLFCILTNIYGQTYLLNCQTTQANHWNMNIMNLNPTNKVSNIFKSLFKPFVPAQNPYSRCQIFFQSAEQKTSALLYSFILFDFQLQMRFLNLDELSESIRAPLWEINLANMLPHRVRYILYAQIRKIVANIATILLLCYEKSGDITNIGFYILQIEINSNSESERIRKLQHSEKILQINSQSNRFVTIEDSQEIIRILQPHQNYSELFTITQDSQSGQYFTTNQQRQIAEDAILAKFDEFGMCLVTESMVQVLNDSQIRQKNVIQIEESELRLEDSLSRRSQEQKKIDNQKKRNRKLNNLIRNNNYQEIYNELSSEYQELKESKSENYIESDMPKIITLLNINQILSASQGQNIIKQIEKKVPNEQLFKSSLFIKKQPEAFQTLIQILRKQANDPEPENNPTNKKQSQYKIMYFTFFYEYLPKSIQQYLGDQSENDNIDNERSKLIEIYLPMFFTAIKDSVRNNRKYCLEMLSGYCKMAILLGLNQLESTDQIAKKYYSIDAISQLCSKLQHYEVEGESLKFKNQILFRYLFLQNYITKEKFVRFSKNFLEDQKNGDRLVEMLKEMINHQLEKGEALTILIWINSLDDTGGFYEHLKDYLAERGPVLLYLFSIAAQKFSQCKKQSGKQNIIQSLSQLPKNGHTELIKKLISQNM